MQFLAFVVLSCLGAAFAAVEITDDTVTIELYKDGKRVERLWPTDDGTIKSSQYDHCKQPLLVATGYGFGLPMFGRDNIFSTGISAFISNHSDFNVLLVNYNNTHYLSAPPIAAAQIAKFLMVLTSTYKFGGENIIFTAHSMGTQVAGYTSQIFRVGTIIAFDIAGPSWDDLPDELRLDRSDTDFLVAVHTSDFVGTLRNDVGHVNLFLDGGRYPHGCPDTDLICPHGRGQDMWLDMSFICNYKFTQCPDLWNFRQGNCANNPKVPLRFDIDMLNPDIPMDGSNFYYDSPIDTGRNPPICQPQDRIPPSYKSKNLCNL